MLGPSGSSAGPHAPSPPRPAYQRLSLETVRRRQAPLCRRESRCRRPLRAPLVPVGRAEPEPGRPVPAARGAAVPPPKRELGGGSYLLQLGSGCGVPEGLGALWGEPAVLPSCDAWLLPAEKPTAHDTRSSGGDGSLQGTGGCPPLPQLWGSPVPRRSCRARHPNPRREPSDGAAASWPLHLDFPVAGPACPAPSPCERLSGHRAGTNRSPAEAPAPGSLLATTEGTVSPAEAGARSTPPPREATAAREHVPLAPVNAGLSERGSGQLAAAEPLVTGPLERPRGRYLLGTGS